MQFNRPRRRIDEEQRIMPLINVVFLLLIFFMVAGQLTKSDAIKIEPPASDSEDELGDNRLRVLIAADGRIVVAGEAVEPADLVNVMRHRLDAIDVKEVHLKADGSAQAVEVVRLMDRIKEAGAEKVRLLTTARGAP